MRRPLRFAFFLSSSLYGMKCQTEVNKYLECTCRTLFGLSHFALTQHIHLQPCIFAFGCCVAVRELARWKHWKFPVALQSTPKSINLFLRLMPDCSNTCGKCVYCSARGDQFYFVDIIVAYAGLRYTSKVATIYRSADSACFLKASFRSY